MTVGTLSLEEMLAGFGMLGDASSPKWLSYTTTNAQDEERLRQMLNPVHHQQAQNGSQKYITCDLAAIDNYLMNPGANVHTQQQQPQGLFGQMQQQQAFGLFGPMGQFGGLRQQEAPPYPQGSRGAFPLTFPPGFPQGWCAPEQPREKPTPWQRLIAWITRPSRKPFMRTERRFLWWRFYR